jgi:glutamate 5-kinase
LLPAGITKVTGSFAIGEPVDLVAPDGRVVARGLVNYDSDELPSLLGRTTRQLTAELGEGYDRTAVHRDALIVLAP